MFRFCRWSALWACTLAGKWKHISSSVRRGCGKELGCSKGSPVLNFLCQSIPKPRWSNNVSTLSSSLGRQHLKNQHYQLLELGTSACDRASSGWHAACLAASWAIGTENQCCDSQLVIPTATFSALLGAWESFFGKDPLDKVVWESEITEVWSVPLFMSLFLTINVLGHLCCIAEAFLNQISAGYLWTVYDLLWHFFWLFCILSIVNLWWPA